MDTEKMWRVLVRVRSWDKEHARFILPFEEDQAFWYAVDRVELPPEVNARFDEPGFALKPYLHVKCNIGQENARARRFADWEPR